MKNVKSKNKKKTETRKQKKPLKMISICMLFYLLFNVIISKY